MAFMANPGLSGLAGLVLGGVGAYLGYEQAAGIEGVEPWQGAALLGVGGLIVGSAGAFVLKSLLQFLIYVILVLVLAFVFRGQIHTLTGVDPISGAIAAMENRGVPLPEAVKNLKKLPAKAKPKPSLP